MKTVQCILVKTSCSQNPCLNNATCQNLSQTTDANSYATNKSTSQTTLNKTSFNIPPTSTTINENIYFKCYCTSEYTGNFCETKTCLSCQLDSILKVIKN